MLIENELRLRPIQLPNIASKKMFESLGFTLVETKLDEMGKEYNSYELILN